MADVAGRASRTRTAVVLACAAVVVLGVGLVVFHRAPDHELETLRADPVARLIPPHAELVREFDRRSGGDFFEGPTGAQVLRVFRVGAGGSRQQVLDELAGAAGAAGWDGAFQSVGTRRQAWLGERLVPGLRLTLTVSIDTLGSSDGDLTVVLESSSRS